MRWPFRKRPDPRGWMLHEVRLLREKGSTDRSTSAVMVAAYGGKTYVVSSTPEGDEDAREIANGTFFAIVTSAYISGTAKIE